MAIIATISAGPVAATEVAAPSGRVFDLFDVVMEPAVARFRFLAPDIAGGAVPFGALADDVQFLCDAVARPALVQNGRDSGEVVISVSATEVPFGEAAPEVTQYFQPFTLQDDTCIWEDF